MGSDQAGASTGVVSSIPPRVEFLLIITDHDHAHDLNNIVNLSALMRAGPSERAALLAISVVWCGWWRRPRDARDHAARRGVS